MKNMGLDDDVDGRRRLARLRYVVCDDDGTMSQQPSHGWMLLSMLRGSLIESSPLVLDRIYINGTVDSPVPRNCSLLRVGQYESKLPKTASATRQTASLPLKTPMNMIGNQ